MEKHAYYTAVATPYYTTTTINTTVETVDRSVDTTIEAVDISVDTTIEAVDTSVDTTIEAGEHRLDVCARNRLLRGIIVNRTKYCFYKMMKYVSSCEFD